MEDLKERLSEKGAKCNLQFSTREREFYEREAGFTDEEIEIFRMRSRGFSVIKISQEMSVRHVLLTALAAAATPVATARKEA
jgi:hypothetical protein